MACQAGVEPRRLYNVVEFMIYDKDGSGKVSFEECMEIMYRRFGRKMLEERTKAFFAGDLNGDNELDFSEFQRQLREARIQASKTTKAHRASRSSASTRPRRR